MYHRDTDIVVDDRCVCSGKLRQGQDARSSNTIGVGVCGVRSVGVGLARQDFLEVELGREKGWIT